jgi:hypothetical protein
MNLSERVQWLNARDPLHKWRVNHDVYCLHCDGVFKAEDIVCDDEGFPTCPVCRASTPIDFARLPWWRIDLVDEQIVCNREVYTWRAKPIRAIRGQPRQLPLRNKRAHARRST